MESELKLLLNQISICNKMCDNLKLKANIYRRKSAIYKKKAEILKKIMFMQAHGVDRNRRIWSLFKSGRFWEDECTNCDQNKFREHFRVSRSTFSFFVNELNNFLKKENTHLRPAISVEKRVAIALYTLGSSAEFRTVANCFGVGRSTVGEILYEFCEAVVEKFEKDFIDFYPPTPSRISEVVKGFEANWGFPQTYGAIDGCHIEVNPPEDQATDYYNYKGWHSIVLLAAVDYKYRFTYINVGSPGRNNDSYLFERSQLKRQHENNSLFHDEARVIGNTSIPVCLIGDSAFRLSSLLMKPYPGSDLTEEQKNFNYVLSRSRRVVENAFGHLKGRFRKIGKGLEVDIANAPIIVKTCCILHNVLISKKDEVLQQWVTEITLSSSSGHRSQPQFSTTVGDSNISAIGIRNTIAAFLFQNKDLDSI